MDKPKMITQSKIIGEYGWTKSLINRFLPDPILKRNPHYSKAAPMRLWEEDTVKKIMETEEFQKAINWICVKLNLDNCEYVYYRWKKRIYFWK